MRDSEMAMIWALRQRADLDWSPAPLDWWDLVSPEPLTPDFSIAPENRRTRPDPPLWDGTIYYWPSRNLSKPTESGEEEPSKKDLKQLFNSVGDN